MQAPRGRAYTPGVYRASLLALLAVGCGARDREAAPAPALAPALGTSVADRVDPPALDAPAADVPAPAADAPPPAPATTEEALALLERRGFERAAASIRRRLAQPRPKMKLAPGDALAAAVGLLELADRAPIARLEAVMPRSTVELARATRQRGLPRDEAERIAAYLAEVVRALDFQRLDAFDENHSHVTGRAWQDIDYSGEPMTWQSQQAYWAPRGVPHFKTRDAIHAYFTGAEPLPHWQQVYRPRGKLADVDRALSPSPAGSASP
jgi:hypothetical protein